MWVTCGLGPYNFEFTTEVKKEISSGPSSKTLAASADRNPAQSFGRFGR